MEITRDDRTPTLAVLTLDGRLNLVTADALRQAVTGAVGDGHRSLVVDLSGVEFLDSSGLGALIAGLKVARGAGGELRIAAAAEQARTVLGVTRLDRVLRPYETVDEALEGL